MDSFPILLSILGGSALILRQKTSIFDEPSKFQRTHQIIPSYLKKYFSYNNQVPINPYYFDNLVEEERATDGANWGNLLIMNIIRIAMF